MSITKKEAIKKLKDMRAKEIFMSSIISLNKAIKIVKQIDADAKENER